MNTMKIQFLLFAFFVIGNHLNAQDQKICVEVKSNRYAIWQNETFEATVSVNGMENTDRLQIFVNGNSEPLSTANSLEILAPGTNTGENKIKILVKIIREDTAYFMTTREIVYYVFYPAPLFNTDEQNVMYTHFWNPLTIVAPGVSSDKVQMSISSGTVKATGPNKFIIKPDPAVSTLKLNVAAKVNDKWISLGTRTYKVKPLPAPEVKLDISTDTAGVRTVGNFLVNMPVGADFVKARVLGWELNIFTNGAWKNYKGTGTIFTPEIQNVFLHLNKGDKIMLENVKIAADSYGEKIEFTGNTAMTW